jgi:hypothetical protein
MKRNCVVPVLYVVKTAAPEFWTTPPVTFTFVTTAFTEAGAVGTKHRPPLTAAIDVKEDGAQPNRLQNDTCGTVGEAEYKNCPE